MRRHLVCALALSVLLPALAHAQGEPPPKIIVVPYPGEADAGVPSWETTPQNTWPPPDQYQTPPPDTTPPPTYETPPPPPPDEPLETRTLEAMPPPTPKPDLLDGTTPPEAVTPPPPGAFLDGQPREGAFLSGPGSFSFIMHHSIMGGLGALSTQLVPRLVDSAQQNNTDIWTNQDARVAYLASTLLGAGVGFGASAWWQFTHWMSASTATWSLVNSIVGGLFLGALGDAVSGSNAGAITWLGFFGMEIGAWATTIVGGGQMPWNHGFLIASGALWGAVYTALILGIIASTGGGSNLHAGFDALMIMPAVGAGAMAAATLKFNPSTTQIMRANAFGLGVGGAVLVLSALVLGVNFLNPVPYILAGVGAIGAKTVVSLLWAEAAETPPPPMPQSFYEPKRRQRLADVLW